MWRNFRIFKNSEQKIILTSFVTFLLLITQLFTSKFFFLRLQLFFNYNKDISQFFFSLKTQMSKSINSICTTILGRYRSINPRHCGASNGQQFYQLKVWREHDRESCDSWHPESTYSSDHFVP